MAAGRSPSGCCSTSAAAWAPRPAAHGKPATQLPNLAKTYVGVDDSGRVADADLRLRIIDFEMEAKAFKLTIARAAAEARGRNRGPSPTASIMKQVGSFLRRNGAELTAEIMGVRDSAGRARTSLRRNSPPPATCSPRKPAASPAGRKRCSGTSFPSASWACRTPRRKRDILAAKVAVGRTLAGLGWFSAGLWQGLGRLLGFLGWSRAGEWQALGRSLAVSGRREAGFWQGFPGSNCPSAMPMCP